MNLTTLLSHQMRVRSRVDGGRLQGARVQHGLRRARPLREQRVRVRGRLGGALLPRPRLRPALLDARTGGWMVIHGFFKLDLG